MDDYRPDRPVLCHYCGQRPVANDDCWCQRCIDILEWMTKCREKKC